MRQFSAASAECFKITAFDGLSAIYDRGSGVTHVVADPIPQILQSLSGKSLSETVILEALAVEYDLPDDQETRDALAARLDEMEKVGLVSPA
jgi:PqqD family protein of HPr-rel-A system